MNYWGQMWAARSQREYSRFEKLREKNPMPTPAGFTATVPSVTRALHPRKLVIYRDNTWQHCEDPSIIINYRFIAISYRQRDVFERGTDEEGKKRGGAEKPLYRVDPCNHLAVRDASLLARSRMFGEID